MMQVLIRVDASHLLGTGHVMRCIALADELVRRGCRVSFAMCELAGHLIAEVEARGYGVLQWTAPWLEAATSQQVWIAHAQTSLAQEADATCLVRAAQSVATTWDWLVVDHYALDAQWHRAVRPLARKILVIDDLADRPLHCDMVLNHNVGADAASYARHLPSDCLTMMGANFGLLRQEFSLTGDEADSATDGNTGGAIRILVSLGGTDATGLNLVVAEVLGSLGMRGHAVTIVAGMRNVHAEPLQKLCAQFGFTYLASTQAMAQLLAQADVAVGAGGVSMLERFALRVPSIVLPIVANQFPGAQAAAACGAVLLVDPASAGFRAELSDALKLIFADARLLRSMSERGRALCDAKGARRVVDAMQVHALELRLAAQDDARSLYEWRNAPQTRAHSGNAQEIAYADHCQWLGKLLNDDSRRLWIAFTLDGPVGVLRFDLANGGGTSSAVVSVYRVPDRTGLGWGRALVARGMLEAQSIWPALTHVDAHISDDNLASGRAFAACGFVRLQVDDNGHSGSLSTHRKVLA